MLLQVTVDPGTHILGNRSANCTKNFFEVVNKKCIIKKQTMLFQCLYLNRNPCLIQCVTCCFFVIITTPHFFQQYLQ